MNFDVPYITEADLDRLTYDQVKADGLMPDRMRLGQIKAWNKRGIVPNKIKDIYRSTYNMSSPQKPEVINEAQGIKLSDEEQVVTNQKVVQSTQQVILSDSSMSDVEGLNYDVPYITEKDLDDLTYEQVIDDGLLPGRLTDYMVKLWRELGIVPKQVKNNYKKKYNIMLGPYDPKDTLVDYTSDAPVVSFS